MRVLSSIVFLLTYIISLCGSSMAREVTVSKHAKQNEICKTPGCIKAARITLANMDKTVQPCDNFYRFACGNYIKESYIEEGKISASIIGQAEKRLVRQLVESMEETIDENDCRALRLLKSHYSSCLGKEGQTRTKVLLDILRGLGGWPVLDGEAWNESTFDWKRLVYQLRRKGYRNSMQSFFTLGTGVDPKNNTVYVIQLNDATVGISQEYLVNGEENEIVQAYYKYMVDVARALGVNEERAEKELADSLHFEIGIAKNSLLAEERRNMSELYNPTTVGELESKYPGIPWTEYINEFLQPHHTVSPGERVIVRNPEYLKYVSELVSTTPKRVLANYAVWRAVDESTPFMNDGFRKIKAKFDERIKGTSTELPRSERCIDYARDNLPLAIGALYVRKVFDRSLRKEVEKLVEDLRLVFDQSLKKVDWMDEKTKRAALRKLEALQAHIAYPDELLDDKVLDKYFEKLKLTPDSYLDSYLSVSLFEIDDTFRQFKKPYNKTNWVTHGSSASVNGYYEFSENSLRIAAGFIQEEMFAKDRPNYVNYGALGYFIGHEFTHAFDDQGSQYDEDGNVSDWWDRETREEFKRRAQCIIDQYSNYTVAEVGLKINGVSTQGENIADGGGIKLSYAAYKEHERRNGPEPRLPGLPYSPRQLFWLSNANVYCEKYRPEALRNKITSNVHCPGEFRVIGYLSNTPEFARDFECPLGSFMNPTKKCTFW